MTTEPVTAAELAAGCASWLEMYQVERQLTASLQGDCRRLSERIAVLLAENESLRLEVNKLHAECGHLQADLRELRTNFDDTEEMLRRQLRIVQELLGENKRLRAAREPAPLRAAEDPLAAEDERNWP